MRYTAANGSPIQNYGERGKMEMIMQVADVTKSLGSVYRWVEADNLVVFDKKNGKSASYIYNKKTGAITGMEQKDGAWGFEMWIPKGKGKEEEKVPNTGRYHALMVDREEESDGNSGFARLDELY